jgi:CheY-like chemotaxis protein
MKVLVIEDDDNKSREIEALVTAHEQVTGVTLARSLHGGRKELQNNTFDLVVLDMTLPNYDATAEEPGGGSVHSFGGVKLLRYMTRLELATPVVVVTQFELFLAGEGQMDIDELDRQLAAEFRPQYLGTVYYHASLSRWRLELTRFLESVQSENGPGAEL